MLSRCQGDRFVSDCHNGSTPVQCCTFLEWHYFHCPHADMAPGCLQVNKLDWIVFNAAWLGVMFAGVEIGLAIAIGTSIVLVLYKTGFPHMAVLGRLPQTTVYRWVLPELCLLLNAAAGTWRLELASVLRRAVCLPGLAECDCGCQPLCSQRSLACCMRGSTRSQLLTAPLSLPLQEREAVP